MNDNQHPTDQVLADVGAILVTEWDSIPVLTQGAILNQLDVRTLANFRHLLRDNGFTWVPRAV